MSLNAFARKKLIVCSSQKCCVVWRNVRRNAATHERPPTQTTNSYRLARIVCLAILLGVRFEPVFAQPKHSYVLPSPTIGWDSLQARIKYGELLRYADVQGAFYVSLRVDSLGSLTSISTSPLNYGQAISWTDSLMITQIENSIKRVQWLPATDNGIRVSCSFRIPFFFYLTYINVAPPVNIHVEKVYPMGPARYFR